jgi:ABC-type transporter Mla maintaining outer membrane lipid asymmetry ATPase subunit MlaF
VPDALVLTSVEKQYGGLRPLRVRDLRLNAGGITMLLGFDRPAAEVFVNLITGASLPDTGSVISLGRPTSAIANSDEWLAFVEQFGVLSDRVVLLDAMTIAQNLAISFDLDLEPVPPEVMTRVITLAGEVQIDAASLEMRAGEASPLLRAQLLLGRALAFDPAILILEHPTATLSPEEARAFASIVANVAKRPSLTTVGLLADEKFAKATGGRLLDWQPATGEMKVRSSLRFW